MHALGAAVAAGLLSIGAGSLYAEGVQISGGVDGRFISQNRPRSNEFKLEGLFINFRKVWSDELGDRWILVAQADFDDNFQRIRPYQAYLQYKGPLGKWNVRGGHYLLPFGLLATYDTERLILHGLEKISLGIRKDTGMMVFGHLGSWDYAVSVTDGLSDVQLFDSRANPVVSGRLAYVRNGWQVGLSTVVGRVLLDPDFGIGEGMVSERRVGLDATRPLGRLTVRVEGTGGTNDGRSVGGGNALLDYALKSKLELNAQYAYWSAGDRHLGGLGLTYQLRRGLFLRVADTYEFGEREGNTITLQLYAEFSKQL